MKYKKLFHIIFLIVIVLLSGCSSKHPLVPSPNIYTHSHTYPDESIPPEFRTTQISILYITDRKHKEKDTKLHYSSERSTSMVFGEAKISFGKNISWKALKKASAAEKRNQKINLKIDALNEIIKFPSTPLPFSKTKQNLYLQKSRQLQKILSKRLSQSSKKEIILFVHGFNNSFEEAALSLADIWHFTGRTCVPLLYSWPAGAEGLTSYFTDRESGEFTIFHLKEAIRIISKTPGLHAIHIIAHSRGTDVVSTALRELIIEERAKGNDPQKTLKIKNLIMAAPDLDFGVVSQRLIAEKFGLAFDQITVYINKTDNALNLSQFLMSGIRFGRINNTDISKDDKNIFAHVKKVNFINVEDVGGIIGHAYFRNNPGVLSDISVIIRNSSKPGSKERPLQNISGNFWLLKKDYPFLNENK